jgi:hypothetical protein
MSRAILQQLIHCHLSGQQHNTLMQNLIRINGILVICDSPQREIKAPHLWIQKIAILQVSGHLSCFPQQKEVETFVWSNVPIFEERCI